MKTDPKVREAIIQVLDDEDAWEHVVMNYISFVPEKSSGVVKNVKIVRLCKKLNNAIGEIMMSYDEIRKESK